MTRLTSKQISIIAQALNEAANLWKDLDGGHPNITEEFERNAKIAKELSEMFSSEPLVLTDY